VGAGAVQQQQQEEEQQQQQQSQPQPQQQQNQQRKVLSVAGSSLVKQVAGSIAHTAREREAPVLSVVGPASVNQAVKAIAIARSYLEADRIDLVVEVARGEAGGDIKDLMLLDLKKVPLPGPKAGAAPAPASSAAPGVSSASAAVTAGGASPTPAAAFVPAPAPAPAPAAPGSPAAAGKDKSDATDGLQHGEALVEADDLQELKSGQGRTSLLAGAIAKNVREHKRVRITAVGQNRVFRAVDSIVSARRFLVEDSIDLDFQPKFTQVTFANGTEANALQLLVIARPI
jgi:stage V sporulation protein S